MHPLVSLLPFLLLVAAKGDDPCTLTTSDGAFYDLSSLRASKDYSIPTASNPKTSPLLLNVCKPVVSETWDLDNPSKVGGYIRRAHGDFAVGQPNTTLTYAAGSVQLYMLGGSTCPSGSGQASTIIDFVCDTAVFGAGQPRLVAQLPMGEQSCSFFVEWRTHVACPTGARSGPWGFFVSLIVLGFILLMLYLTLGTVYNRFVLNLRGFDQIPSFSLEGFRYHASEALDWFRDTMSGMYEGGQGGRYSLPRTNPVSHQTGVDGGDNGGFVRLGRNRPNAQPTNPVSHQSQVNASQPRPLSTPPPPSPTSTIRPAPPSDKEEERPFMLGDDDDEDGEVSPAAHRIDPPSSSSASKASPAEDGVTRM